MGKVFAGLGTERLPFMNPNFPMLSVSNARYKVQCFLVEEIIRENLNEKMLWILSQADSSSELTDSEFKVNTLHIGIAYDIQSILSNSNSLGDRKNVRITKSSNYRDSNYRGVCLKIFKGSENFVRISKSSNCTSSNWTELMVCALLCCKFTRISCSRFQCPFGHHFDGQCPFFGRKGDTSVPAQ